VGFSEEMMGVVLEVRRDVAIVNSIQQIDFLLMNLSGIIN
jgi:hypothetical protein